MATFQPVSPWRPPLTPPTYLLNRRIRLQPANPDMEPLYLRHDEIEILGIVSGTVRMNR